MATIDGTNRSDDFRFHPDATRFRDIYNGRGGNDIFGGDGDLGRDIFRGDAGNDFFAATPGADRAYGGAGNDTFSGGLGDNLSFGGAGDDYFELFLTRLPDGTEEFRGGGGADILSISLFAASPASDLTGFAAEIDLTRGTLTTNFGLTAKGIERLELHAQSGGADRVVATAGDGFLLGGNGDDTLSGGAGADSILGEADRDVLNGNLGNDTLEGGAGNDALRGHRGNDSLRGEEGRDELLGHSGDDRLHGGTGNDRLFGGGGADGMEGGDGRDLMNGGAGADVLIGGLGRDTMTGGNGPDQFQFSQAAESGPRRVQADRITDFTRGEDLLRFAGFELDVDAFVGRGRFTGMGTKEVRFAQLGLDVLVEIDSTGDGNTNFALWLENVSGFGPADLTSVFGDL